MSQFVRGSGSVTGGSDPVFQLLDPTKMHGATSFYYDFYVKRTGGAAGNAIWQIEDGVYANMPGAAGVSVDGEEEHLKSIEIGDGANTGLVKLLTSAGDYDYYYVRSGSPKDDEGGGNPVTNPRPPSIPVTLEAHGSTSSELIFFLDPRFEYTITSDGAHSWEYCHDRSDDELVFDGSGTSYTAFAEGATNGFTFDVPATRIIRLDPTGPVNFSITSVRK